MRRIKIGGETRPVKFGFNAYAEFGEITHRALADIENIGPKTMTLKDSIVLCYAGLKEGARKEGNEFPHTVEDVGDWLDDEPTAVAEIIEIFTSSQPQTSEKKTKPVTRKK